jgi:hypothetical protein
LGPELIIKTTQLFAQKAKFGRYVLLDIDITGLQKMTKDVSTRFQMQTAMTALIRERYCQRGSKECSGCTNVSNRIGRYRINVAKYTILPNFDVTSKLLHDL